MAFWLYRPEQFHLNTPILEISEHAAAHGFNDREMDVVCLHGMNFIPPPDRRVLAERKFILHDASALFGKIAARYPNLARRYPNHYFECFLRWIVLDEFYRRSPIMAWDADIFLNAPLSRIETAYAGSTFTASSTCFAVLHDPAWLEEYTRQLDAFERAPEVRLTEIHARLQVLHAADPASFATSFFGEQIARTLHSFAEWQKLFDSTPEEMLVDFLVRERSLPVHVATGGADYLVCAQPLLLPRLAWVHALAPEHRVTFQSDAAWTLHAGSYSYGGRPLAFLHFQGALFRACAIHQLFNRFLESPQSLHDDLYSPPDRRHGLSVGEYFYRQRPLLHARLLDRPHLAELRKQWGDPYSERDVARNVMIRGNLLELFADYEAPPPLPPPAATETPADLAEFVAKLGTFFQSEAMLQLEWSDAHTVAWSEHRTNRTSTPGPVVRATGFHPRLPLPDAAADTIFNLGSLALLDDQALPGWLAELERITARNLWIALNPTPGRNRVWWETRLLEAGLRKHPLYQCVTGYAELGDESTGHLLLCEKIPGHARLTYPLATLRAERDLHMDMLREPGIRSDAHLARYILAREHVRPGHVVLDAACGLGYGAAALATGTGVARVIGVDLGDWAINYAKANFGVGRRELEFYAQDATRLKQLAAGSVDLIVSFETLEHMPNPELLLREFARVLKPGGTFIGSVPNLWMNEHGHNPVPYHLHIYDHDQLHDQVARYFTWTSLYRQNAGGGWKRPQPRGLQAIPDCAPSEADCRDAEWWIAVATKPVA